MRKMGGGSNIPRPDACGLFETLADSPSSVQTLAKAVGASEVGVEMATLATTALAHGLPMVISASIVWGLNMR